MDRRPEYRYTGVDSGPGTVHCLTFTIITFNVISAVLGATMVALGFWITLDTTFKRWVQDLAMEHFWVGVYILMAAGALVMLQSFFGICGAFQRKGRMLILFCVCLVICFCLELGGGVYMLNNGIRGSHIEGWLSRRFYSLISQIDYDPKSSRIMNIIQEWVGCCGAQGLLDYVKWNKVIPYTCYSPITGNAWYVDGFGHMGCVRGFTTFLETKAGWIAGVAFILALFQIFCFVAACYLIRLKRDYQKSQEFVDTR